MYKQPYHTVYFNTVCTYLYSLLASILIVYTAHAALPSNFQLPAGITQHSTIEGITEYRLDNGLTILLLPDNSQTLTTVNITYKVGSKHENYGETGMAHLLEHLLFKGTPNIPNLNEAMHKRGFKMNGTTYFDRTNYYETFNANADNLAWAIHMEADRMVNSFIAKKDLDSEMNVVLDELRRGENSSANILGQRMMAAGFDWHNYGKPTIGNPNDLNRIRIESLQNFYAHYYQPDNAVLTIAGPINIPDTLQLIVNAFKKIPKPKRVLIQAPTIEPTQEGEKRIILRRNGDSSALAIQYHLPAPTHPDYASLTVWSYILGNEPAGRLYQNLNKHTLAASTYSWINSLAERSIFIVGAKLEGKHSLDLAESALIRTIETPKTIALSELNRAKIAFESEFKQLLKSPENMAIVLSESIGQGDWRLLFLNREAIKYVTIPEINRVVNTYLTADNRTIGHFISSKTNKRAPIPYINNITEFIQNRINNTQFSPTTKLGEIIDTHPDALEKRTQRSTLNKQTPYPIPLLTLYKKNRNQTNTVSIALRWGNTEILNNQPKSVIYAANWVAPLLLEGNQASGLSKQKLTDTLSRLESTIRINSTPTGALIHITSTQSHLIEVIHLLNTLLKRKKSIQYTVDPLALTLLKSQQLAQLNTQLNDPQSQINDRINEQNNRDQGLTPNDWRYRLNTQQIREYTHKLNIKDIEQFYRQFWTMRFAQVSAVGTLPDNLSGALEHVLDGWSASQSAAKYRYIRPLNRYFAHHTFKDTLQINDKKNALLYIQANLQLKRDHIDYWPLQIGVHILGGNPLTSRIGQRIRVKEGLSYRAGNNLLVDLYDDHAIYQAYASFLPTNLQLVNTALHEELSKILTEGISAQELADTQSYLLSSLEQQRNDDAYLSSHLLYQSELGLDFSIHNQHRLRIQSADITSVNAALKRYLNNINLYAIQVAAGDFNLKH